MLYVAILVLIMLVVISGFIISNNKYYDKILDIGHYNEIASWAVEVLTKGEVAQPSVENGTVLMTRAGILIVYMRSFDDCDSIHFSISQMNRMTTHAVGGRIIFLLLTLLNQNHCNANFFYTNFSVHHLVLQRSSIEEWQVNSIDWVLSKMHLYQPLPL